MTTARKLFSRNKGLISRKEQSRIANSTIAIAGLGGDGGFLAERLARFGVTKLILADPEVFELSNINRQYAANSHTLGMNKAQVIASELSAINPNLEIEVYPKGITEDNVKSVVMKADVVVDEIEYSTPRISVMLHQEARKQEKVVFMGANIGWGASIFCFDPNELTFEEFFDFDEESAEINALAYFPSRPQYLSAGLLRKVLAGQRHVPSVSSSVALVASVLATDIVFYLTEKRPITKAPQYKFIDLYNFTCTVHTKQQNHEITTR